MFLKSLCKNSLLKEYNLRRIFMSKGFLCQHLQQMNVISHTCIRVRPVSHYHSLQEYHVMESFFFSPPFSFSPHSKPNKKNPIHLRSDCLQTFEAKEGDSKGKRLISRVTFHLHKQVTIGHCGMSVNGFHYRNSA